LLNALAKINNVTAIDNSPHNTIPPLIYPLSDWSRRVSLILDIKGINVNDADAGSAYLPTIIARLPISIGRIIPKDSLYEALQFLANYESRTTDLNSQFGPGRKITSRPSIAFSIIKETINDSFLATPIVQRKPIVERLAWASLSEALPQSLKTMVPVLDIKESPSKEQLSSLDKIWDTTLASNIPQAFEVNHVSEKGPESPVLHAINKLSAAINAAFDSRRPLNNFEHRRTQSNEHRAVYPNRSDFCYYHRTFGIKAHKCKQPCAWIPTKNSNVETSTK